MAGTKNARGADQDARAHGAHEQAEKDRNDTRAETLVSPGALGRSELRGREQPTELAETLHAPRSAEPGAVDLGPVEFGAERYERGELLGAGGMGEVYLESDHWIGREVAVKVMRSRGQVHARFLREARVQGQLEHPSIVPVYDLGSDESGSPFFSMRRVRGHTLEQVLADLRDGSPEQEKRYSRRRLLTAASAVCQAVAYAHQRGVVHRDLKPANIMLGEFGEVYVLDWGVAKIVGAADVVLDAMEPAPDEGDRTAAGALVGTPGYMAPEQAMGDNDAISPATDVYALGAILFELLTREPMHRGHSVQQLLLATMNGATELPSERCPQAGVAPELDRLCQRATSLEPSKRYSHAGELAEAIERYLDGERDAEYRSAQATRYLKGARGRLESADARERTAAMRDVGRALALEPDNAEALTLLMDWIGRSADEHPDEVRSALQQIELEDRTKGAGHQAFSYVLWFLLTPLLLWMGVRSWTLLGIFAGLLMLVLGHALLVYVTGRASRAATHQNIYLSFLAVGFTTVIFGPLFLLPGVAAGVAAAYAAAIRANPVTRVLLGSLAVAAVLVPTLLQWIGWIPATYGFEGGVLSIHPLLVDFPEQATLAFLVISSVMQVALVTALVGRGVDRLLIAERQNFASAWHLRQLLPMQAAETLQPRREAP